jgi:hypothetical protein
MNTIDPNNPQPDTSVVVHLPRVITATDYHDFRLIQSIINHDLGAEQVFVTEVGYSESEYVALIHLDCESHNQLVMQLTDYYREDK